MVLLTSPITAHGRTAALETAGSLMAWALAGLPSWPGFGPTRRGLDSRGLVSSLGAGCRIITAAGLFSPARAGCGCRGISTPGALLRSTGCEPTIRLDGCRS